MNYDGPKQLADSTRSLHRHTVTIAEDIPEERYGFRLSAESRSVRETLCTVSIMIFDLRGTCGRKPQLDRRIWFPRAFFASLPVHEKLELSKPEILAPLSRRSSLAARCATAK
jgi:hypothetical protein